MWKLVSRPSCLNQAINLARAREQELPYAANEIVVAIVHGAAVKAMDTRSSCV